MLPTFLLLVFPYIYGRVQAATTVTLFGVTPTTTTAPMGVPYFIIPTGSTAKLSAAGVGSDGSTTYVGEIGIGTVLRVSPITWFVASRVTPPTGTFGSFSTTTSYSTGYSHVTSVATVTLVAGASSNKFTDGTDDDECHWDDNGVGECTYKAQLPGNPSTQTTVFTGSVVPIYTYVALDSNSASSSWNMIAASLSTVFFITFLTFALII